MATNPHDPMLPRPWRIGRIQRETYDTFTIELEPVSGDGGFGLPQGSS
jgi:hypothetical protein